MIAPEKTAPTLLDVRPEGISSDIRALPQFVVWKLVTKEGSTKPTKIPFNARTQEAAKSNDPATWSTFDVACSRYANGHGRYAGVGFMFAAERDEVGIDLDDCRDPQTGEIEPWALEVIQRIATYSEVSPSGTGVKLLCRGKLPGDGSGKKRDYETGAVEMYGRVRFFALTGHRLPDSPAEIVEAQEGIDWLWAKAIEKPRPKPETNGYTRTNGPAGGADIIERARRYVAKMPEAISGQGGHNQTFAVACALVLGFDLTTDQARPLLEEYSARCVPPWSERELEHKLQQADGKGGERGYLRDAQREQTCQNDKSAESQSQDARVKDGGQRIVNNTDVGNGQRLVEEGAGNIRYCHPMKTWYFFVGTHWTADTSGKIERLAKRTVKRMFRKAAKMSDQRAREAMVKHALETEHVARIAAMIKCAQSEPGVSIDPEDFDRDIWALNFKTGTVDLRTGALRPHRREDYISKISPVEYIADAGIECPLWESVLYRVLAENGELIAYTQRLLGYFLTGSTREQILPIWWGEGQNGKSTILNIILDILGEYGGKAAPELLMSKKMAHPTELADLFGKRLIVANETDDGGQFAEALAKDLTGSDRIKARKLYQDFFQFTPTHKIVLATNHPPKVKGTEKAFWRRIKLTPFSVVIPDDERDDRLPEKLKAELPGIARWLVEGCLEWQRDGLQVPEIVTVATANYRKQEDTFGNWLEACCVVGQGYNATAAKLLESYLEFSGDKEMSKPGFAQVLKKRGFINEKYSAGPNKARMGWWGLGLVSDE